MKTLPWIEWFLRLVLIGLFSPLICFSIVFLLVFSWREGVLLLWDIILAMSPPEN